MIYSARLIRNAAQTPFLHARLLPRVHSPSIQVNSQLIYRRNIQIHSSTIVPRFTRNVYTSTQTSSKSPSNPPPVFNVEKARKANEFDKNNNTKAIILKSKVTENQNAGANSAERVTTTSKKDTADSIIPTEVSLSDKAEEKDKKIQEKKLNMVQKIKKEARHYWDGTKLLATEIKISTKLVLKMAAGYELSRRENKQLQRTVKDIARLVPFSVFILVPFAELLLPVALKLFPNMLPSTYEGQKSKETKATNLRATRQEVGNFLRNTLKETGLPLSPATAKSVEFTQFFRKIRATGESPSATEVINVCKIFKDDLTLDNLSRPQLVAMCRYINLNTFGTDMMLRYQIRHRMRQIKRDDRAISFEGVDSLSVPELQMACMSRGLRTHGASPSRLRDDLQTWLDLRLNHGVPSTLLVLSNAFMYAQGKSDSEFHSQIDALIGVLSSIPEELFHEMELEINNAQGDATNKQRLEVLKEQQDLIEEENEQDEENKESGLTAPPDNENIDEKDERRGYIASGRLNKASDKNMLDTEGEKN